tara:strand:+ start:5812 stop:7182 length:1371 start_codon:yes stop_codon:yes gene_type:complete
MCGIIGIYSSTNSVELFYELIEGLMCLQHRGQDSAGIANEKTIIKHDGLVKNNLQNENFTILNSNSGIGHVRYSTNGSENHIQPLFNNFPRRITMVHNGNIINKEEIRNYIFNNFHILTQTSSDSELVLLLFSCKLYFLLQWQNATLDYVKIFKVVDEMQDFLKGSYCLLFLIENYGMIVIRDKFGIRPLIWGKKDNKHIIASESVALSLLDYKIERNVLPGECIIFENDNSSPIHHKCKNTKLSPCLFEYIYFARPDSVIDGINVNEARVLIGRLLGEKIKNKCNYKELDYIIPIPDTSVTFAHGVQEILQIPIRDGFIKNRYIDRTFIMKNKKIIQQNIKRKLSGIENVFKNKNILIIDDSIVRGNTSKHIIECVKQYNCKKLYFASCSPIIKEANHFGIFIPKKEELISYNRNESEIQEELGVDVLIYNDLDRIVNSLKLISPSIESFEVSMF